MTSVIKNVDKLFFVINFPIMTHSEFVNEIESLTKHFIKLQLNWPKSEASIIFRVWLIIIALQWYEKLANMCNGQYVHFCFLYHLWMFLGCSSQVEHQEFEFYVSQVTKLFILRHPRWNRMPLFFFQPALLSLWLHSFLLSVKIIFGWKPFTKVTELMITQCYVGKEYLHNVFIQQTERQTKECILLL